GGSWRQERCHGGDSRPYHTDTSFHVSSPDRLGGGGVSTTAKILMLTLRTLTPSVGAHSKQWEKKTSHQQGHFGVDDPPARLMNRCNGVWDAFRKARF
ncbi:hypothetical protein, partial [Dietzia cinnamea]|uniref:hypothetical protein n=1 Tax=Dietzia cinnamea TaxID=321318 RepID=UPI001A9D8D25